MAQPTNTFDTYDTTGIREDLSNVIYDVSPDETPLLSAMAKVKATNTFHEWQTNTLRAAQNNFHVEGSDTSAAAVTPTDRLGNYSQIFKGSVITSGTNDVVEAAGRTNSEMAYNILRVATEVKLDMEKALFENVARVAGNATTPRKLAGLGAWLKTNVVNIGANGANPSGNVGGATARTDGTKSVFNQAKFDTCMQSVWTSGGKPDTVYLSAFQLNKALGFVGNNNQRQNGATGSVNNNIAVYLTPWGSVEFQPVRESRSRDVWIIENDKLALATLRPMKNEALAKTGDNEHRQVVCEATMVVRNQAALGLIADCTDS
tara:strand:- start:1435 stop:2388 length:954 start_codon:yes stop_codon:yes gene_type:complete